MTNQLTERELKILMIIPKNIINEVPIVGMGATMYIGTDQYPFTVIGVTNKKEVTVQMDKATRTDSNGMDESQTYSYEPDSDGEIYTITLRKNGRWVQKTKPISGNPHFFLGKRNKYYDFSF